MLRRVLIVLGFYWSGAAFSQTAAQVEEVDRLNREVAQLHRHGSFSDALKRAQQTVDLAEKTLGLEHPGTAKSVNNLGFMYDSIGEYHKALPLYQRALEINEKVLGTEHPDTASCVNNLGALYDSMGQYDQALPLYQQALKINEKVYGPEHPNTAGSLNNLGFLYKEMGQYDQAMSLYQSALAIREKVLGPEHTDTAESVNNLGALYDSMGQYDQALPLYQRALKINEKVYGTEHPNTAGSLNNLGLLYKEMEQYDLALPLYTRALALTERLLGPEHPDTARGLHNLSELYQAMGRYDQALPLVQRALSMLLPQPLPVELATAAGSFCRLHRRGHAFSLAIFYCKLAVNAYQQVRQNARNLDPSLQRSLTGRVEPIYQDLAKLLIQEGRFAEAEQVLGMLKEYEFFEFVRRDAQNDTRTTRASYTQSEQSLVGRLEKNAQTLSALYAKIEGLEKQAQLSAEQVAELDKLREQRSSESERLAGLLNEIAEQLKQQMRDPMQTLAQLDQEKGGVRDTLAELHDKTQLRPAVVYLLPGEKDTTFLVISKDGAFSLQAGEGEQRVKELIASLREQIQKRDPKYRATANILYQALIQPIRAKLTEAKVDTLMLYLTDYLRYLPFAALYDAGHNEHLVAQYALSIYTHVGRETLRDDPSKTWSAVALGVSEAKPQFKALPAVETELLHVVRDPRDKQPLGVFEGQRHINGEFTRKQFMNLADGNKRFSVMHVATHFNLAPGNEDKSFLLAGDGDQLTLKQIRTDVGIKFRGYDLVTLSACETFIGSGEFAGSEVEGLGALLQKQGAKAVLASLWRVEDTGTARLMEELYKARGEQRATTKTEALRQAQRKLLSGKANSAGVDLTHPYFWAPFVLMGNWM